jgi:hypothetical protein
MHIRVVVYARASDSRLLGGLSGRDLPNQRRPCRLAATGWQLLKSPTPLPLPKKCDVALNLLRSNDLTSHWLECEVV